MKIINRLKIAFYALVLCAVITYTTTTNKHRQNVRKPTNKRFVSIATPNKKNKNVITHVTLTCYRPLKGETDNDPLTTADGSKIDLKKLKNKEIRWCAISRDLLYLFPKNKPRRIYIQGYGEYYVKDVMNKRFNHRVDLLIHPNSDKRINAENVKIKVFQ